MYNKEILKWARKILLAHDLLNYFQKVNSTELEHSGQKSWLYSEGLKNRTFLVILEVVHKKGVLRG